jgi:sugar phosphate isomerase/epimerase
MPPITRQNFLKLTLGTGAAHLAASRLSFAATEKLESSDIGIYTALEGKDVDNTFKRISDLGFKKCELYTDEYGTEMIKPLKKAMQKYNMQVLALFTLGPGSTTWDFYGGQRDIGLVSKEHREARVDAMIQLSNLARECGIGMIETHAGFLPENPNDPNYKPTVEALKKVIGHCAKNRQHFLYHAGQESPTTLLRTMLDVGFENQGVGMDTANLIMYDRGHPYNALDVYGKYIRLVNAKDGLYPTDPRNLGKEVPIGEGKVNFSSLFRKLKANGYSGSIIIEREGAEGAQWNKEVIEAKRFLQKLL